MGIDVDGGLASTHLMFVKRGLADKWREQGIITTNLSLRRIPGLLVRRDHRNSVSGRREAELRLTQPENCNWAGCQEGEFV
jgi:hypothetical protein